MASSLPPELIEHVGWSLEQLELLALRATCRSFVPAITPLAFREMTFSPTPKSIDERLLRLASDLAHLAPLIRRIRVYCANGEKTNVDSVFYLLKWPFPFVETSRDVHIVLKEVVFQPALFANIPVNTHLNIVESLTKRSVEIRYQIRLYEARNPTACIVCGSNSDNIEFTVVSTSKTCKTSFPPSWIWSAEYHITSLDLTDVIITEEGLFALGRMFMSRSVKKIAFRKVLMALGSPTGTGPLEWGVLWATTSIWSHLIEFTFEDCGYAHREGSSSEEYTRVPADDAEYQEIFHRDSLAVSRLHAIVAERAAKSAPNQ